MRMGRLLIAIRVCAEGEAFSVDEADLPASAVGGFSGSADVWAALLAVQCRAGRLFSR